MVRALPKQVLSYRHSFGCHGLLQVPLLLVIFVISFGGFGIWGFLRNWRFLVGTQLRLDKCVGQAAIDFRDILNSLESSNQKMGELRVAISAASLQPELIPPLKAALQVLVVHQEILRLKWQGRQGAWIFSRGCGRSGDRAVPLPILRYFRDPPDLIGAQPLRWPGQMPQEFYLHVDHLRRESAANVRRNHENKEFFANKLWKAAWCPPRKGLFHSR